jgi:predicted signal transduction protein with EAL and GGDEF domain
MEAPLREHAAHLARQIIALINEPFLIEGNSAFVGTSVGVALAPDDGVEAEELLKKADLALYKSKSQGRNGFTLFDARMTAETSELHKLENEMRAGLARGEFEVHYQPIVDARTEAIRGAEALVRWRHPELGVLSPERFVPLAESTGLIVDIGEFVLNRACLDAANWPGSVRVAVNLSAVQFRKANLFDVIMAALRDSTLSPARLEVEVTESVLLENESDCASLLRRLKTAGVTVALDDFGTGYSSLSYLKQFPFDKIKIDRSFTADVADDAGSMAIVSAIVGLSRGMDMITTAEGIETASQFSIMRAAGVTLAQGYLFGRPCPADEFTTVVRETDRRCAAV